MDTRLVLALGEFSMGRVTPWHNGLVLLDDESRVIREGELPVRSWQSALCQLADTLAPNSNVQIDPSDPEESCARIVEAVESLGQKKRPEVMAVDKARLRHWHSRKDDPYTPYSGMLHDQTTDELIDWRGLVEKILRELLEGSKVSIIVAAEPVETDSGDIWVLLRPHEYGHVKHLEEGD